MPEAQTIVKKDARGREIEVRKLKPMDRLRLFEIIGADNALNGPYLGYATFAYSVTKIDGQDRPLITSKIGIESVIKILDEDGFEAVAEAFRELHPEAVEQDQATLKNE